MTSDAEHGLSRVRSARDVGQQDLPQRRRKPRSGRARATGSEQLLGEERVAVRAIEHVGDKVRARLDAEDGRDQGGEARLIESEKLDPLHAPAALELGEPRQQRMASMELVDPICPDQCHGHVREGPDEERDRLARGRVRPMEVLEDEEDRRSRRQSGQEPEEPFEEA
jgi:hypothetical protein